MKLSKFFIFISSVTAFSLIYVWQQTEVVSLAYDGQKRRTYFQELLDENSNLRYNLKKNTSLVRLGSKVSQESDFQMPSSYCIVKVSKPAHGLVMVKQSSVKKKAALARMLGIGRQAEAKTINPSLTFKAE